MLRIREQILNFLAPNSGTRERIKGQIDMELIEQQYLQGCLDYKVKNRLYSLVAVGKFSQLSGK